eukprot:TRINITY_DN8779_c1_g1_i1.p1 TRINITY_DN8779_c1_g1~~TRINITY_DN8779_c1_g1_i1.p1  ORF type:complete len:331 (-),score=21.05 TRINITY_DN8779_c1_g1_i1:39-989(-)
MGEAIPRNYTVVETKLSYLRMVQPTIPWAEFKRVVEDCNVPTSSVLAVTKFYHDIGALVYFNEDESGLNQIVILDAQWLTSVFATVVTMKSNYVHGGVLKHADLPLIWRPPKYPHKFYPLLLALMDKFEISYTPKDADPPYSLIPCLVDEPHPAPDDLEQLTTRTSHVILGRCWVFEFLPLGFFPKFVVRLLSNGWTPAKMWRNGVVLCQKTETVQLLLLEGERSASKFVVYIAGAAGARRLVTLVEGIQTLITDWLEVQANVYVPCPSCRTLDAFLLQMQLPRGLSHCSVLQKTSPLKWTVWRQMYPWPATMVSK